MGLALNNLQSLIYHKTEPKQSKKEKEKKDTYICEIFFYFIDKKK